MNFDEMRLSIQLDRRYTEGALNLDPAFSTPHFITTLIDNNCLRDDRGLPILHEPTDITAENISMKFNKRDHIWYVCYGSNMLNERFLCYLKGGAFRECSNVLPACEDNADDPLQRMKYSTPYIMLM